VDLGDAGLEALLLGPRLAQRGLDGAILLFLGLPGDLLGAFLGVQEAFQLVVHDQMTSRRGSGNGLEFRYFSNFQGILTVDGMSVLFRHRIFELDQQHASASTPAVQIREPEMTVLARAWTPRGVQNVMRGALRG
jgi:hypothetical protein